MGRDRPIRHPYLYAPGRGAEHAVAQLVGFNGVLQVDGYAAYNALADPGRDGGPVTLAYCWSHVRRRFYEIAQGGDAPIAEEALRRIGELYRIESIIRGHPPGQRRTVRHEQSKPIVRDLLAWLEAQRAKVPGRSRIAEAIRYALKLWPGLVRYLDDGRIEIDSNSVERSIRPIALNRKNALFAGSDEGASCCSSHHAFIIQEDFVGGRQAAGVVSAARRRDGERRRSTGRPVG